MSARGLAALAFLSLLAAVPSAARAEDADALIKQGVELRRARKDREALEQFRRAYDLAPTPRALAQMGLAEQALERWLDAEAHLGRALEAAQDPWIVKFRETLARSRADVAKHLGWLEIGGRPEGAEVRVDGELVGVLPLARMLRVASGSVVVDVSARGHPSVTRTLAILPGQVAREEFVLSPSRIGDAIPGEAKPAESQPPSPPPRDGAPRVTFVDGAPPSPSSPALRKAAWISLAVAGGLAVVGGAGFLVGEIEARRSRQHSCEYPSEIQWCNDRRDYGTLARNIGTVTLVGAGVAGVTGAVLFFASRPRAHETAHLVCAPDPSRLGAACAVRF